MANTQIFQGLEGTWRIERSITPCGVFTGTGLFERVSDLEYLYTETGNIVLNDNYEAQAYRSFIYKLEAGEIAVYFNDGENKGARFHTLTIDKKGQAKAEHLCGEDFYVSEYVFKLPKSFHITHHVNGPKKDYVSITNFTWQKILR